MGKVICDICGTTYPETSQQCPICGYARDLGAAALEDEFLVDMTPSHTKSTRVKGGRFSASNVRKRNQSAASYDVDPAEEEEDESLYPREKPGESNKFLVVLLLIVILALLAVTGFIFMKFFLPNAGKGDFSSTSGAQMDTQSSQEETQTEETTIPTVPCEVLECLSADVVELLEPGQYYLINAKVLPEDTTDVLTYESSNEEVAVVNSEGRIEAVGEGEALITVKCGDKSVDCVVVCFFGEEETEESTQETEEETEETTEEPTEPLKDITLKVIRWTDLTFNGSNQGFTFVLDGLENNEVQWTSMDEKVATVDENGRVLSVGKGETTIICQYGEQKVEIVVRCKW